MNNPATTPAELDDAAYPAEMDDPSYLAFLAELDADHARATRRRTQQPPLEWGTRSLGYAEPGYFCTPCWKSGDETGFHPDSAPPCDASPRGPFDPR